MAALTGARSTIKLGLDAAPQSLPFGVAAGVKCFKGGIAVLNAAGFLQPATTALGLTVAGVFEEDVDNSVGANGAKRTSVRQGVFKFNNSAAGDLITLTETGKPCFLVDDNTVAKTNGGNTRSTGGIVAGVDPDGVWFDCSVLGRKS